MNILITLVESGNGYNPDASICCGRIKIHAIPLAAFAFFAIVAVINPKPIEDKENITIKTNARIIPAVAPSGRYPIRKVRSPIIAT